MDCNEDSIDLYADLLLEEKNENIHRHEELEGKLSDALAKLDSLSKQLADIEVKNNLLQNENSLLRENLGKCVRFVKEEVAFRDQKITTLSRALKKFQQPTYEEYTYASALTAQGKTSMNRRDSRKKRIKYDELDEERLSMFNKAKRPVTLWSKQKFNNADYSVPPGDFDFLTVTDKDDPTNESSASDVEEKSTCFDESLDHRLPRMPPVDLFSDDALIYDDDDVIEVEKYTELLHPERPKSTDSCSNLSADATQDLRLIKRQNSPHVHNRTLTSLDELNRSAEEIDAGLKDINRSTETCTFSDKGERSHFKSNPSNNFESCNPPIDPRKRPLSAESTVFVDLPLPQFASFCVGNKEESQLRNNTNLSAFDRRVTHLVRQLHGRQPQRVSDESHQVLEISSDCVAKGYDLLKVTLPENCDLITNCIDSPDSEFFTVANDSIPGIENTVEISEDNPGNSISTGHSDGQCIVRELLIDLVENLPLSSLAQKQNDSVSFGETIIMCSDDTLSTDFGQLSRSNRLTKSVKSLTELTEERFLTPQLNALLRLAMDDADKIIEDFAKHNGIDVQSAPSSFDSKDTFCHGDVGTVEDDLYLSCDSDEENDVADSVLQAHDELMSGGNDIDNNDIIIPNIDKSNDYKIVGEDDRESIDEDNKKIVSSQNNNATEAIGDVENGDIELEEGEVVDDDSSMDDNLEVRKPSDQNISNVIELYVDEDDSLLGSFNQRTGGIEHSKDDVFHLRDKLPSNGNKPRLSVVDRVGSVQSDNTRIPSKRRSTPSHSQNSAKPSHKHMPICPSPQNRFAPKASSDTHRIRSTKANLSPVRHSREESRRPRTNTARFRGKRPNTRPVPSPLRSRQASRVLLKTDSTITPPKRRKRHHNYRQVEKEVHSDFVTLSNRQLTSLVKRVSTESVRHFVRESSDRLSSRSVVRNLRTKR